MNKKTLIISLIVASVLVLILTMSLGHVEYNPKQPEYINKSVRVWGVVDPSIWEGYSDLVVNTMFPTIKFTVENIGNQDLHNISLDYIAGQKHPVDKFGSTQTLEHATYFCEELLAGETKTFSLTKIRLRDLFGKPCVQLNFGCDELPKNRAYNAAAFGVIFLDFRWQPGETHSNEEAFVF